MIQLTDEQRRELTGPETLAVDPATQQTYVLIRKEVYERMRALLEDDMPSMEEVARLVERNMKEEDEGDPTLEYYQQKYGRKP